MSDPALCLVLNNRVPASHSALAAQLTPALLGRLAKALELHSVDIDKAWSCGTLLSRVAANDSDVGPSEDDFQIVPTTPDAPGAEAYHDLTGAGIPDGFCAIDEIADLAGFTQATGHEADETLVDPLCNRWATAPSGIVLPVGLKPGMQIAFEPCDPLQDRIIQLDIGDGGGLIALSDCVTPAYFDVTLAGPTSLGELLGLYPRIPPFGRTVGGYHIARNGDGSGETQLFGMIPKDKLAKAQHPSSRWLKRGVNVLGGRHLGEGAVLAA